MVFNIALFTLITEKVDNSIIMCTFNKTICPEIYLHSFLLNLFITESFVEVRKRLRKAEELSDLKTMDHSSEEEDTTRRSKRKKRYKNS